MVMYKSSFFSEKLRKSSFQKGLKPCTVHSQRAKVAFIAYITASTLHRMMGEKKKIHLLIRWGSFSDDMTTTGIGFGELNA